MEESQTVLDFHACSHVISLRLRVLHIAAQRRAEEQSVNSHLYCSLLESGTTCQIYWSGVFETSYKEVQVRTQNFSLGGWKGADPEAIYNLFDFQNHVIKIMS